MNQVKEIIRIFGNRWQSMTFDGVVEEVNTIIKKSKKKIYSYRNFH